MDPEAAATELDRQLKAKSWYVTVGIGEADGGPALFVYTRRSAAKDLEFLKQGWQGFPVIIRRSGAVRPLASAAFSP